MRTEQFISLDYREDPPPSLVNAFVLKADNWNDYSSHIRFDLIHYGPNGQRTHIGKVKVLHRTLYGTKWSVDRNTRLPPQFSELDDSFASLGQSQDYYANLRSVAGPDDALEVLKALRDIAEMPGIAAPFETSPPFRNGMVRENAARRARRFGRAWARGEEVSLEPRFQYVCRLGTGAIPTVADFDFDPSNSLPGRIVAIIGRNAVGKTIFLSNLAADLAQVDRLSEERLNQRRERFNGEQPVFSRVIAISYSAFDRFRRPEPTPFSSYIYCGIRDDRGNLTQRGLRGSYLRNLERIREHGREDDWVENILTILGDASGLNSEILLATVKDENGTSFLDTLSSGQAILCQLVTGLLSWIEPESIVLFDEPETHLHPNAVANLFVVLIRILKKYDSYAVLATHSPVVLQEVPSKRVLHFRRDGDSTTADELAVESFGESITELTRHVFNTFEVENPYKAVLARLAAKLPAEEVLSLFPKGLGMAAQSYLLAQYAKKEPR